MKNFTTETEKTQPNLRFGKPPEIIICFACRHETELDGFVFKLVPVCAECRTASELKHLSNRIARRENG